jgi:hypothetical protein
MEYIASIFRVKETQYGILEDRILHNHHIYISTPDPVLVSASLIGI